MKQISIIKFPSANISLLPAEPQRCQKTEWLGSSCWSPLILSLAARSAATSSTTIGSNGMLNKQRKNEAVIQRNGKGSSRDWLRINTFLWILLSDGHEADGHERSGRENEGGVLLPRASRGTPGVRVLWWEKLPEIKGGPAARLYKTDITTDPGTGSY